MEQSPLQPVPEYCSGRASPRSQHRHCQSLFGTTEGKQILKQIDVLAALQMTCRGILTFAVDMEEPWRTKSTSACRALIGQLELGAFYIDKSCILPSL